jgi:hypothetical protein
MLISPLIDSVMRNLGKSRCTVFREGSTQSINTGTWTKVQLNTERFDTLNEFNTSTYRFTALSDGYYFVVFSVGFRPTLSADKKYMGSVRVNGSSAVSAMNHSSHSDYLSACSCIVLQLSKNDYVELWVYHNSGGSVNLDYSNKLTYLSVQRVS